MIMAFDDVTGSSIKLHQSIPIETLCSILSPLIHCCDHGIEERGGVMSSYGEAYTFSSLVSEITGRSLLKPSSTKFEENIELSVLVCILEILSLDDNASCPLKVYGMSVLPFSDSFPNAQEYTCEKNKGDGKQGFLSSYFYPIAKEKGPRTIDELEDLIEIALSFDFFCIFISLKEFLLLSDDSQYLRSVDCIIGPVTGSSPKVFALVRPTKGTLETRYKYEMLGAVGWYNSIIRPFRVSEELCFDCYRVKNALTDKVN